MQKKLNVREIMDALVYSKKIRLNSWDLHQYVYFKNNAFFDEDNDEIRKKFIFEHIDFNDREYCALDEDEHWELYD